MITIIVDNQDEYEVMMEATDLYVCRCIASKECDSYSSCRECYKANHIKAGVRIIPPVDRDSKDGI